MTENEKVTLWMYLIAEDFRLQNQLDQLYENLLKRKLNDDDLIKFLVLRAKMEYFKEIKQNILYLLNIEN